MVTTQERKKQWRLDERIIVDETGTPITGLVPSRMTPETLALVLAVHDLRESLVYLLNETEDYIKINHLAAHHNQSLEMARRAIAKATAPRGREAGISMDELSSTMKHIASNDWHDQGSIERFDAAAQKWAVYCLRTMTGTTLRAGLEVSRAMADFLNETVGDEALAALRESLYRPEEEAP